MTSGRETGHAGLPGMSGDALLAADSGTLTLVVCGAERRMRVWGRQTGHPLLLLNSVGIDPSIWSPAAEQLARDGCRVVAPWLWEDGAGGRLLEMFLQAHEVVNALEWRRFDLAGVGGGGALAWMMAAALPGRVCSVASFPVPRPPDYRFHSHWFCADPEPVDWCYWMPSIEVPTLMVEDGARGEPPMHDEEILRRTAYIWFQHRDGEELDLEPTVPPIGSGTDVELLIPWLRMLREARGERP